MRVLAFLNYYLPGYKGGGPIRTLANMVEALGDEFQFSIVASDRDFGDERPYPGIQQGAWQRVGKASVWYLRPEEESAVFLRKLMRGTAHELLYLNSLLSRPFSMAPLFLNRVRLVPRAQVVIAPRGELSDGALGIKRRRKRLYLLLARFSRAYRGVAWHASSSLEAAEITRYFGQAAHVRIACNLPGVDTGNAARNDLQKSPGELLVAFVSRISPKKNLDYALNCLGKLSGRVQLDIYGPIDDPDHWRRCQEIIGHLAGNISAQYRGAIPNEEVGRTLSEHHVLLLPTRGENFGHVILEALANGCPILISDQTPWQGLEQKNCGWALPLDASGRFEQCLQQLINMDVSTWGRMSHNARQYAVEFCRDPQLVESNRRVFRGKAES
jgi:glycosyltransferase involved in cell wall biosynthesis